MPNTAWNPADKSAGCALSGSNLTATFTSGGQGVRAANSQTTGKYYFEVTCTTISGTNALIGVATSGAVLTTVSNTTLNAAGVVVAGSIYVNGVSRGVISAGGVSNGNVVGVAVNLDNRLFWLRIAPSGNWNNNAAYAPGGTGGIDITPVTGGAIYPLTSVQFSPTAILTGNFGDSAFTGAVPGGFTAGWPTVAAGGSSTQALAMILA